jgi:hypothetical protein
MLLGYSNENVYVLRFARSPSNRLRLASVSFESGSSNAGGVDELWVTPEKSTLVNH